MARKVTKEARIKAEVKRLHGLFSDIGEERLRCVEKLIDRAAFYTVTLEDLESVINRDGPVSHYQNGENQYGTKQSPEAALHVAMHKNLVAAVKQLIDLLPDSDTGKKKGDPLLDYIGR